MRSFRVRTALLADNIVAAWTHEFLHRLRERIENSCRKRLRESQVGGALPLGPCTRCRRALAMCAGASAAVLLAALPGHTTRDVSELVPLFSSAPGFFIGRSEKHFGIGWENFGSSWKWDLPEFFDTRISFLVYFNLQIFYNKFIPTVLGLFQH